MKKSTVELKCFGLAPGLGNSALVVRGDTSDSAARLRYARAQGKPACVFIDGDAELTLDFYYTHKRSPLCGHASLAAAHALVAPGAAPLTVRTAMHGQPLRLTRAGDIVYLGLRRQAVTQAAPDRDTLRALLRAPALAPVSAPTLASVGSPKLLVQVADSAELQALRPDLQAIAAWSETAGVNGIYAWCERADGTLEGRNFNHLDPALEDSATGVAAGALTVLLGRPLRLHQGAVVDNPCLIHTRIDGDSIEVGGLVTPLS